MSDQGTPRLAPVGQSEMISLLKDLLEAQQDTNALLSDLKSEVVTLRRVTEEGSK